MGSGSISSASWCHPSRGAIIWPMSQKKPVMGRGLEALLGQMTRRPDRRRRTPPRHPASPAKLPGDELAHLPLDLLQRGKYQPRVDMRQESLQELADSIKAQGIVQPIVVRPVDGAAPGESQRYEIIAGERRWRAAQIAGLPTVPAVIRRVPDEAAIAMALIENIQRENLNPLEEARALDRLISEFGITHQQAADAVGRSRAAVSNLLRLLELPPEISAFVERRELEMGHARALLGLTQRRQQVEVGQLVAKKSLSVRETEALVRSMLNKARAAARPGHGKGSTRTCSACRTSSRKSSARRCRSSTRARARARWSSATTRSMSSTASWRTYVSGIARWSCRLPPAAQCRPRPRAAVQDDFASAENWAPRSRAARSRRGARRRARYRHAGGPHLVVQAPAQRPGRDRIRGHGRGCRWPER